MAENGDAACFYPQEILDLNWNTTSKERIQKAYKVWSVCYDKVLFWGVSKHSIIRDVCELRQGVITKDWPGVREKKGRDIWKLYVMGRHPKDPQR